MPSFSPRPHAEGHPIQGVGQPRPVHQHHILEPTLPWLNQLMPSWWGPCMGEGGRRVRWWGRAEGRVEEWKGGD